MADEPVHTDAEDLTCIEEVEIMTDYLEGALSAADARRLERHLETCPGCTAYLEQMRTLAGSLDDLGEGPIPQAMRDDLVARFQRLRGS